MHCAARRVFVDRRRLTLCVGSGRVGTNATGLVTLRPDFVRVGNGVYEEEMSDSSCSQSVGRNAGALMRRDLHRYPQYRLSFSSHPSHLLCLALYPSPIPSQKQASASLNRQHRLASMACRPLHLVPSFRPQQPVVVLEACRSSHNSAALLRA